MVWGSVSAESPKTEAKQLSNLLRGGGNYVSTFFLRNFADFSEYLFSLLSVESSALPNFFVLLFLVFHGLSEVSISIIKR